MISKRDITIVMGSAIAGGVAMQVLYPATTKVEYRDVIKTVQVQQDTTKEAAKITVIKKVFIPGAVGTKACDTVSETTTVTEAPKQESKVKLDSKEQEKVYVSQTKLPAYAIGAECSLTSCLDSSELGITFGVRLGNSPFKARASFQPKSLRTGLGLEVEF